MSQRSCEGCSACCHGLVIEEIKSPAFTDCPHQCEAGCGIYADRPGACRDFKCLWLLGHLSEADRPDRLGVIFSVTVHPDLGKVPMLTEVREGALDQPKVNQAIHTMSRNRPVVLSGPGIGKVIATNNGRHPMPNPKVPLTIGKVGA